MKTGKRRTTLTLPAESLCAAERIARTRKVNLSVVISEVIEEGLRARTEAKREGDRRLRIWETYRQSLSDLSEDQRVLLDGIVLSEPVNE
ncbi:MAG TPA: hypothetical protein VMT86_04585 [Bryobacteraceae bacterium]|nr:hypothetical protein [Bryobacteraceae bacterium]